MGEDNAHIDPETGEILERSPVRRFLINRELLAWFVVVFLLGIAAGALIVTLSRRTEPQPLTISTRPPLPTPLPTVTPGPIKVYVSGEVANPAVYELPVGSIIQDLIEAAGGFTADASQEAVNLAFTLNDGTHIHVPGFEENNPPPVISGGSGSTDVSGGSLVNINQADLQELEELPGIGPSLAQAILDYREQYGAFQEVDELLEVPGIGPVKFEAIKDLITVR